MNEVDPRAASTSCMCQNDTVQQEDSQRSLVGISGNGIYAEKNPASALKGLEVVMFNPVTQG